MGVSENFYYSSNICVGMGRMAIPGLNSAEQSIAGGHSETKQ